MNMYAVWFMGFMLVYATILWDLHKQGKEITQQATLIAALMAVGSWPVLIMICIGIWLRDNGYINEDGE